MDLKEWLLRECGIVLDVEGVGGVELADRLERALAMAGFVVEDQLPLLMEATRYAVDRDFYRACLERVDDIRQLQQRRSTLLASWHTDCHNRGAEKHTFVPAGDVVAKRFNALWDVTDDNADLVDDMVRRLAAEGYILLAGDAARDLRQGLGYYRRDEDRARLRAPVRWLRRYNTLHYWVNRLTGGDTPLCAAPGGIDGKWVVAAELFADRQGHAILTKSIRHGVVGSSQQRHFLDTVVPRRISFPA